ncbi:MAG: glucose-1-phosphate thymidylyltransferase, partial [Sphingobacteriales bacterium]
MPKASGLFLFLLLMTINLFDDSVWESLRPLTFTRPVADLRVGILTIAEKWAKYLNADFGFNTQDYLSIKYPAKVANLFINGSVCPDEGLLNSINNLNAGEVLLNGELVIAFIADQFDLESAKALKPIHYNSNFIKITYP